jgi:hypothetical protein
MGSSALLAQLVEHLHGKEGVSGSSPEEGFASCLRLWRDRRLSAAPSAKERRRERLRTGGERRSMVGGNDHGRAGESCPHEKKGLGWPGGRSALSRGEWLYVRYP